MIKMRSRTEGVRVCGSDISDGNIICSGGGDGGGGGGGGVRIQGEEKKAK
ncbi:hypothetical protein E2C01_091082 [Portunus trituberculatus]|uniref:Uncharacterized protein n=1 Tax=Portunus trituberculatus TaxID=210409 RepID=A0A5B7JN38_PORTR|nr:hypothetical protein [Portunus trituberculatus]